MSQRFSIVNINDGEYEVFLCGHAMPKDLKKSKIIIGILTEKPSSDYIPFQIQHCYYLDEPGIDEDITSEDLVILIDVFDDLVEDDFIYVDKVVDFEWPGLDTSGEVFVEG